MAGFNDFVEKHNKGINTIAFWAIVGLSTAIGGIVGGGFASIVTAPLFGFLGSLLYVGITKAWGKWTGEAAGLDRAGLVSDITDVATSTFGLDNASYIDDGFWASYKRQVGNAWDCTVESIKSWFRPKKPSVTSQVASFVRQDSSDEPAASSTNRPPYMNQQRSGEESKKAQEMRAKYNIPPKGGFSSGLEDTSSAPESEPEEHGFFYNLFHRKPR